MWRMAAVEASGADVRLGAAGIDNAAAPSGRAMSLTQDQRPCHFTGR
jgi:hypothetical protein